MRAKAEKLSSPPPAEDTMSMPASKVLGDDDLLGEILIRLSSPACLLRAALVSRRWLRGASHPAFLRLFRALHPPRLLGFYVSGDSVRHPEFVSMATIREPPDTELSDALRRASSGLDAFPEFSSAVCDCRNSRVLINFLDGDQKLAVRDALRYPGRDTAVFSPPFTWSQSTHAVLLPDDPNDDASCYRVDVEVFGRRVSVEVSALRSGAWTVHSSAWAKLPRALDTLAAITLLAGGKLYVVTMTGYIIGLDLAAASLFFIELPEGVAAYEYFGSLALSRGDDSDSAFYLLHVKGDQLGVWLRRMNGLHGGAGAGEWVLKDTISVRETCGHLADHGSVPADGDTSTSVVGVGDNAEFVFLELKPSGAVVYMHLGSRRAEKVYQREPGNYDIIDVHPLLMVCPPVLPALEVDEDKAGHHQE